MTTSVYIHLPFCEHLCTYCDFCKMFYNEELCSKYLDSLEKEINSKYRGETLKTLYIGGGTPSSLSINNLKKLMKIIKLFHIDKDYEFTFEVNPENITKEKLLLLKENGVNRISMGVESTSLKYLRYLGRLHDFNLVKDKIKLIKELGFSNINVDLIYALPHETINDLKKDLDNLLSLDINHISTYSLEIHNNTILGIKKEKNISEELDNEMYEVITSTLEINGFKHYEISNFCKNNHYSRHNLVYWHNEEYYGFGLGASGYYKNIRYDNTRSINSYLNGKYIINKEILSKKDKISYELILGFRLIKGINKKDFFNKYHEDIEKFYNIKELIVKGYLILDNDYLKVNEKYLYVENSILENFVD